MTRPFPRHESALFATAAALLVSSGASAAVYHYSLGFDNGFLAAGEFTTKASAPASFIEKNPDMINETTTAWNPATLQDAPYAATYLESHSMRVSQGGLLLGESQTVIAGICTDKFLYLNFTDAGTPTIAALDFSTVTPGATSYYFVTNGTDPAGDAVAFGSTGYNLFLFDVATLTGTYIGTATSFSVSLVPAPGALSLLAFAGGACASRRRRA